jgi:pyruvate/2-oxoglutarate dehydrogenase complex dihydrolipoamide dehydrogenase (E3) component
MATYDLAVIGAGTGGLLTAAGAAQFGARVALIERDKLGDECLYTGCVPSKALIHCAKVASLVRRAGEFDIDVPTPSIDFPRVMAYVRQVVETIGQHDSPERFRKFGVDVIQGQASFVDASALQVGEQRLTSKQFVIATGSRSTIPPIEGLPEAGCLTHVEALNLTHQPRSLVILGAGPIGIEFAQLLARLGTKVTVLEVVGQILPREDPEVAHALEGYLRAEGVELYTCTRAFQVDVQQGVKVVHGTCDVQGARKGEVTVSADAILVAAGRVPNIEGLGLERVCVETTEKGIVVDDHMQTTAKHVWTCGDVTGKYLFTHVAEYQARLLDCGCGGLLRGAGILPLLLSCLAVHGFYSAV